MSAASGSGGRVGFVGLGHMGVPMTRRLLDAGYRVVAYDIDPDARAVVGAMPGATAVDRVAAVAPDADFVVLMLPGSAVVEDVLFGGGLLDALSPDTVLLDMSSSEPRRTQALAARAGQSGITVIDAPVSGGVRGAETGTLTVMVGAQSEVFEQVRPLLDTFGSRVLLAGPVGAGHAVKALNNLMSAAHLLASSEAMLTGMAFGLDPTVILDIVNGSSGRSGSTQTKWPDYVLTETYGSGFSMQLMVKDMRIAVDLAQQTGTPARLSELAVEVWSEALEALPSADHTEIARWLGQRSGALDAGGRAVGAPQV